MSVAAIEPTITFTATDGSERTLEVSKIQFFWKKFIREYCGEIEFVTQIVCNTDEADMAEQEICRYVFDIDPRIAPFDPGKPIKGRAVVDTKMTMNEVADLLRKATNLPAPCLGGERSFIRFVVQMYPA
jgi:hypothetical protein